MENNLETEKKYQPSIFETLDLSGKVEISESGVLDDFEQPTVAAEKKTEIQQQQQQQQQPQTQEQTSQQQQQQQQQESEPDIDLMGAMTMLNFGICLASSVVGRFLGYEISADKISANETQLKKMAKVGEPLYEKYVKGKMSAETAFIVCLVSIYGGKIMANAEKIKTKEKPRKNEGDESSDFEWIGNPDYYQTGKKAGQKKPNK